MEARSKLKKENLDAVEVMLGLSPKLAKAYLLKERFLDLMDSQDVAQAKQQLALWFALADSSGLEEFNRCLQRTLPIASPKEATTKSKY